MKLFPLFWLLFFLPSQALAQRPECQTFQSAGEKTLTVDPSYGGYYLVGFGLPGEAANVSLSVSGARESADGGADFHLTFTPQDLPAELPVGIVNGLQFEITSSEGEVSDFWVMLGTSPQACLSTGTPTQASVAPESSPGPVQSDRPASASSSIVIAALAVGLSLALVAFLIRKRCP